MNLKPRRAEEPEINLVSLIDVVLMLVVFFLLSSEFIEEGRVRIQLPEGNAAAVPKHTSTPIVVTVTQTGGYRINERELINASPDTLRAALLRAAGADRSQPVTIRADARATHQSVVTVMDVAGRLGFAELDIATVNASPPAQGAGAR
jgi:biopolymer transport protein ExbD